MPAQYADITLQQRHTGGHCSLLSFASLTLQHLYELVQALLLEQKACPISSSLDHAAGLLVCLRVSSSRVGGSPVALSQAYSSATIEEHALTNLLSSSLTVLFIHHTAAVAALEMRTINLFQVVSALHAELQFLHVCQLNFIGNLQYLDQMCGMLAVLLGSHTNRTSGVNGHDCVLYCHAARNRWATFLM